MGRRQLTGEPAWRDAASVRSLLDVANVRWVHPVVVLWCEFPAQVVQQGGVSYVNGAALAEWLAALPEQLSDEAVALARSRLETVTSFRIAPPPSGATS
jgi:hypothetical protein